MGLSISLFDNDKDENNNTSDEVNKDLSKDKDNETYHVEKIQTTNTKSKKISKKNIDLKLINVIFPFDIKS
jgi:hypothetical protein